MKVPHRVPWSKIKVALKENAHLITVALVYIVLFTFDYIAFTSFVSIGFFSLLLTDHLVDGLKKWLKARQEKASTADNKPQTS